MKITREENELVVRIPLKQNQYNQYESDEPVGETDNLVGIIAGGEYTLSQLIDLSYKDDIQEGMPILYFSSKEELEDICQKYNIPLWEHPVCTQCRNVLRGVHTYGKNGVQCLEH